MLKNIDLTCWKQRLLPQGVCYCFPVPENAKGEYLLGFVRRNDSAFDAMEYEGIAISAFVPQGQVRLTVYFADCEPLTCTIKTVTGEQELFIAWEDFAIEQARRSVWQFVTAVSVEGCKVHRAVIRCAEKLAAECEVCSKSTAAGQSVCYTVQLYNPLDEPIVVAAKQVFQGWESICARITPSELTLQGGQQTEICVELTLSEQMVPGGHEDTQIRFVPNGDADAAVTVTLQTLCALPHPYLYHDKAGWAGVAEKIKKYPQFRPAFERWKRDADNWFPQPSDPEKPYCYYLDTENDTMAAAYLYALTGEKCYAEKLARFFRYFTDEQTGYPAKRRGCHCSYVQEGHFFQHLAIPYDIIHDAGVLTPTDHAAIERSFRLYMEMLDKDIRNGRISNWVLSEVTGALYCALSIQDWTLAQRFAFGEGGVFWQMQYGTFNDGWWHECSIGYNTWVSSMVLHSARALRPFGVDMIYAALPVSYGAEVSSSYACQSVVPDFAMVNQKWGGNRKNALYIKDLFDAVLPFLDWRGVMFGVNDSDEKKIGGVHFGSTYDLAYTYYKNPEYLRVIRSFAEQDPVFGHPELALAESDAQSANACSDNIGIAMLRSQTPGRAQKDQIQAVLHYGSHGGAHGHFDITNLLSVMRYGRSLYNPEANWWGYRHFMYKWHVQNSLTKNMVNVDDKLQYPADSRRILFHSGKKLQAVAVETACRWAYPPYGGMDYDDSPHDFEKRLEMNKTYFPVDKKLEYAQLSGFTEPILQRRVMAVTDDYIVLFDYMNGEASHQYETTFQFKGLRELSAETLSFTGRSDQYTTDAASDGQMITDCQWYAAEGTSVARFCQHFAENEIELRGDRSSFNCPGELCTDVYTAWPPRTTQVTGLTATYYGWPADMGGYNLPLTWQVQTDDTVRQSGTLNAWILGRDEIDVDLTGAGELKLCITQGDVLNEKKLPMRTPSAAFWADAVLTFADGSQKKLCELFYTAQNTDAGYGIGKDYHGGRVLIQGHEYPDAIPASPLDHTMPSVLCWDLSGCAAVRLQAVLGADPIPGDESQHRMFYAVRAPQQKMARFTTVIEPYESEQIVRFVRAQNADTLTVWLKDGRTQTLILSGMEEGKPVLSITETNGTTQFCETTQG